MLKGQKIYKQYKGVKLIESGCNCYSIKGNTQLGKLIKEAKKELTNCGVFYEVVDRENGVVNIIYKEHKEF